ncbi:MAG: phosphate ABC transporter permease PstA [bacterium]|nr:phosphate ABC transporter permease PstA [bacterium]
MRPRGIGEWLAYGLLYLSIVLVTLPVAAVLFILVSRGYSAISWEFLTAMPRMGMRAGGIFPAIMGTLLLVLGTVAIALPLGVMAAIYLSEYAGRGRLNRLIHLAIVNLAGVPSVVYGLFGLGAFVLFLKIGVSLLAGCLTLALMILPVIITASEEALQAVPQSFREASLALGATRWKTIWNVVLPSALPGILTGAILGVGRAAGETAPILFTAAAFFLPRLPKSIFDQVMALPYHLYIIATQVPNIPQNVQYGTALVLVALVLLVNASAIILRSYIRRRRSW